MSADSPFTAFWAVAEYKNKLRKDDFLSLFRFVSGCAGPSLMGDIGTVIIEPSR